MQPIPQLGSVRRVVVPGKNARGDDVAHQYDLREVMVGDLPLIARSFGRLCGGIIEVNSDPWGFWFSQTGDVVQCLLHTARPVDGAPPITSLGLESLTPLLTAFIEMNITSEGKAASLVGIMSALKDQVNARLRILSAGFGSSANGSTNSSAPVTPSQTADEYRSEASPTRSSSRASEQTAPEPTSS